ncbi:hypothetical protein [Mycobacterium florentinum]|uniref:hypothetical protein n=1 Tax=Mycobacterium florentinum TaxID=292462 RepID=UPI0013D4416C|nr:hypothetical protein [Mycobacterium florentinum]
MIYVVRQAPVGNEDNRAADSAARQSLQRLETYFDLAREPQEESNQLYWKDFHHVCSS